MHPNLLYYQLLFFLKIGYYNKHISSCDFYIPLSFPLEIMYCVLLNVGYPTKMDYIFILFGHRIFLFQIAVYHYWQPPLVLMFLGLSLFVLNYLSTSLTLFGIKKVMEYYSRNKE